MRDWNPKLPEMPVDKDGNWLDYPQGWDHWEKVPEPFYAEFVIDRIRTGRSSKKVILKDIETGKLYPMFVADMVKGIQFGDFKIGSVQHEGVRLGSLVGYWTGSKRGANYGIKAVQSY